MITIKTINNANFSSDIINKNFHFLTENIESDLAKTLSDMLNKTSSKTHKFESKELLTSCLAKIYMSFRFVVKTI